MRLSDFIASNREDILREWEDFARTCTPASSPMDIVALRDHADEMLSVIVEDLNTPQDAYEQSQKSKGEAPEDPDDAEPELLTAAEEHGSGRAASGFSMEQMVSEYRALRASVIRLWIGSQGALGPDEMDDLTRFNEAVDQSLAESVSQYTEDLEYSKEMFLAILGHDLRTPLGAIFTSSRFMLETEELEEPHRTLTSRIASSATRMDHLVGDLLDFTRSRLGGGIPIETEEANLGRVVHDVVDEISAAHPGLQIEVDTRTDPSGEWDPDRISQALTNLLGNAVEHGSEGTPIGVELRGDEHDIEVSIHNRGAVIPPERMDGIFNPMKAAASRTSGSAIGRRGNLGLGLYIAERIVNAHGGRIDVESSAQRGTTFTIHLPRRRVQER